MLGVEPQEMKIQRLSQSSLDTSIVLEETGRGIPFRMSFRLDEASQ